MSDNLSAYSKKLLQRAESIWKTMGLNLKRTDIEVYNGATSIRLNFENIIPTQAELIVSQIGIAFRKARIFWKPDDGIQICIEIPPM